MATWPKITVCGCGSGAMAMAADLALLDCSVRLYEVADLKENLDPIRENGGISLTGSPFSGKTGLARLDRITDNPQEAVEGSQLIFVNVPATAVDRFVQTLSPHFSAGQTVVVTTGYWAALRSRELLMQNRDFDRLNFVEFSIMPYLSEKIGPAQVHISNYKRELCMAAWPATKNDVAYSVVQGVYPQVRLTKNVLELNFQPGNPGVHPQVTIPNAAFFFERARVFRFYAEVSECASKLADAYDAERTRVAAAFDCETISWPEYCRRVYEYEGKDLYELCADSTGPHQQSWSSIETTKRLLVEDLCYSFVPMEALAKVVGVEVPITTAMIEILAVFTGYDYRGNGLTLKDLGVQGFNREQIINFVNFGRP